MTMATNQPEQSMNRKGTTPRTFRKFALRLGLFWLPIFLVVVCGVETMLWRSGETWPIGRVIDFQKLHPDFVFLRRYFGQDLYSYKWQALMQKRPDVVVLGSSRVMKFRAEMFGLTSITSSRSQFYNCGGMIQSAKDFEEGVDLLLAVYNPKLVIIGVDMWWLNGNYTQKSRIREEVDYDAALDWRQHMQCFRNLIKSREALKEALSAPEKSHALKCIGLGSVAGGGIGFRSDGSISGRKDQLPVRDGVWHYVDAESPPVRERAQKNTKQFIPTDGLSRERLDQLERAISGLRNRGVRVIAFLPPFSNEVAEIIQSSPEQRRIWAEYREIVPQLFKKLEVPCLDASTPARLGLDDRYMVDGFHGEETMHLHILKHLLELPECAGFFPDAAATIDTALASKETNFWYPKMN